MEKKIIIDSIIKLVEDVLELTPSVAVTPTTRLDELGIDSIALMTIGVYLEEEFNIELGNVFFRKNPETIDDIVVAVLDAE